MPSKVIIFGATGEIGLPVAKAIAKKGHETTAVVRKDTISGKSSKIAELKASSVKIVEGTVDATEEELVKLLQPFDVVVSTLSGPGFAQQPKLISAAAKAHIKRFLPSEFGHDVDVGFPPALEVILGPKRDARRQLKEAGLPYTAVVSHMFANWAVGTLGELTKAHTDLTDEVNVYDGGNNKGLIAVDLDDIGAYTAATLDDPRTVNQVLHIAPPANRFWSQNQLIDVYEELSGKKVVRKSVSAEDLRTQVENPSNPYEGIFAEMTHYIWVEQAYKRHSLALEASALYPEVAYTTIEQYVAKMAKA